jgi:hypothetical protein
VNNCNLHVRGEGSNKVKEFSEKKKERKLFRITSDSVREEAMVGLMGKWRWCVHVCGERGGENM